MDNKGFVYVLEVADITLPVCKIGMTTRDPFTRCAEINNSSTGDFLWEVSYSFYINDCKKFERLIHQKLLPLRQKKREFFNITPDDAYNAIISIINNQSEIYIINEENIDNCNIDFRNKERFPIKKDTPIFNKNDLKYVEVLQSFNTILAIKGKAFGQLNNDYFGMSDGNEGVQWNLTIYPKNDQIRLGVNLEGKKYKDWPISNFILNELKNSRISKIQNNFDKDSSSNIIVSFYRDAWQVTSRPNIKEKFIGGKEYSLEELDELKWKYILEEALGCLDRNKNYKARNKQMVTTVNKKRIESIKLMEVSPHLNINKFVKLNNNFEDNLKNIFLELMPIYEWVKSSSSIDSNL
jgi:hypothetical protein